ncbi:hypothetical protein HHJ70_01360 [Mobiluncus curtisii]|uniref:Uncharacterized protein n=1 Tax=Mobiluncus curtisii ATCC 51333 TaxID=887326 RepID=E6M0P1_9ACTO|nr:hypothetical protein HMPREF0388_1624 [Mobiluncus curtisii ATCC 51333]NMW44990.1 hypothetical protein [Mobiluncus curtisii]
MSFCGWVGHPRNLISRSKYIRYAVILTQARGIVKIKRLYALELVTIPTHTAVIPGHTQTFIITKVMRPTIKN